jgi:hypothetical protein
VSQALSAARDSVSGLLAKGYVIAQIGSGAKACNLGRGQFYQADANGCACEWLISMSKANPSAKPTEPGGATSVIHVTRDGATVENLTLYFQAGQASALPDSSLMDSDRALATARTLCAKLASASDPSTGVTLTKRDAASPWVWSATVFKTGTVSFDAGSGKLVAGCQ